MSSEIAISVRNVGKCYQVYDRPQDRLKESLIGGISRVVRPVLQALTGKHTSRPSYYREFWALSGVTVEIGRGETFGIVGLNGSGKSTLLQIIAGTVNATSGIVSVNGRVAALLELGSGFNPEFTGRENVYLNGAIHGLTRNQIDSRFESIAAFADIGDFIDQPVKMYSSGMALRLAFSVIAHVDADILIIDEALSVGDVVFSQKCMRFLREFQERGTIVFVSHDSGAIVSLCNRALWLERGRVRMIDNARMVSEAYVAAFYERLQGPSLIETTSHPDKQHPAGEAALFPVQSASPSFGKGGARIADVALLDETGARLSSVVGGEPVSIRVRAQVMAELNSPIIGFYVKDRLGQYLFGDNTFLAYRDRPIRSNAGDVVEASFAFLMPVLPAGHYSVAVALAEGTQNNHLQHHWIHDAIQFDSHSTSASTGLVGIPMRGIVIKTIPPTEQR